MSKLIETNPLTDNCVYGVRQCEYTVDGMSGKNFIDAVTIAAFMQATAIEDVTSAYTKVVAARQEKIEELSEVLSLLSKANAQFESDAKSTDTVSVDNAAWVKSTCEKYDVGITMDGNKITYGDMQKANTDVQYAIDREDNDLQQDMVTLESYVNKRDNAFSTASKVVKKANNAATATIGNIGS